MNIAIIGGGPAGLMAAEAANERGAQVDLYDAMASPGRKFLLAGKGGLNLTHSEPFEPFLWRYGVRRPHLEPLLTAFDPDAVRTWALRLGIETFVGTSGRVFPLDLKAAPLLRAWLRRLRTAGVNFHMRHRWNGWSDGGTLCFDTPQGNRFVNADAVILALGGGSWPQLGSDGAWVPLLTARGVRIEPLRPANCGFDVDWSRYFREKFAGHPVKTVAITTSAGGVESHVRGECVITETGIEGGAIYPLSACLREEILKGAVVIHLDLAPDRTPAQLVTDLSKPRGSRSMANHLKRRVHITGVKSGLLHECLSKDDFADPSRLAAAIKSLPVRLIAPRPLEEAISTAGGVSFEALDERLMIRALPGVFCAGEMLDWEAPTGGYLLTACFASGRAAGTGAVDWIKSTKKQDSHA